MSAVWLYCVTTPDGGPPDGLRGVADAPVLAVDVEGLRAWYAEPDPMPEPSASAVARHHRVVEAAWRASLSCAPARFGQTFPGLDALRGELRRRVADMLYSLAALEDTAEMGLRVFPAAPSAEPPPDDEAAADDAAPRAGAGPGRVYLEGLRRADRARRDRTERHRALAEEVTAPVAQFVLASRLDAGGPGQGGVALAHLVSRRSIQGYEDAIERVAAERDDVRIVVEGPWPPYSFVARAREDRP